MQLAQHCNLNLWHCNLNLWHCPTVLLTLQDLAEVLGSATALYLLTGMPLWAGVLVTASDVIIMMFVELRSFRALEVFVVVLTFVVAGGLGQKQEWHARSLSCTSRRTLGLVSARMSWYT